MKRWGGRSVILDIIILAGLIFGGYNLLAKAKAESL
jgi:endonuclease V-like protein UPF0215 family